MSKLTKKGFSLSWSLQICYTSVLYSTCWPTWSKKLPNNLLLHWRDIGKLFTYHRCCQLNCITSLYFTQN